MGVSNPPTRRINGGRPRRVRRRTLKRTSTRPKPAPLSSTSSAAGNTAADAGNLFAENAAQILEVLQRFDGVFAVLEDRDAEITRAALDWAEREGRLDEASPELVNSLALTDNKIEALIAERTHAKKTRNFARADAIRNDLLAKGILLEDSKDGVRWKRK